MKKKIVILSILVCSIFNVKAATFDFQQKAEEQKYTNALNFLHLGLDQKALLEFQEYLELYPEGNFRADVYQRLFVYYQEKFVYKQAIFFCQKLYEEEHSSEVGIGAYYQEALCYEKIGNISQAQQIYQNILNQFFESSYAQLAMNRLQILNLLEK